MPRLCWCVMTKCQRLSYRREQRLVRLLVFRIPGIPSMVLQLCCSLEPLRTDLDGTVATYRHGLDSTATTDALLPCRLSIPPPGSPPSAARPPLWRSAPGPAAAPPGGYGRQCTTAVQCVSCVAPIMKMLRAFAVLRQQRTMTISQHTSPLPRSAGLLRLTKPFPSSTPVACPVACPPRFDDCLPQADQTLGPDYAPPALPLPPGEDEDEEEEARVAAEEAARGWGEEGGEDGVHPALDADAILRRMLLQGMRDRRSGKRPLSGAAAGGGVAAAAAGGEGWKGAVAVERAGSGSLRRRLSAAGARVSGSGSGGGGGGGGGGSPGRGSPVQAAVELGRRGSSSGSAKPPRPASASPASPFAATTAAAALGSPGGHGGAASGGGPVSEAESWLDEVHRSAESAIALLTRGSVAAGRDGETAGGSGSRAVRSVLRARRSGAGSEGGGGVGVRGPGPVAESREGGDGSSSDGSGVSSSDSDSDGGEEQGKSLEDLKDSAMGLVGWGYG